MDIRLEHHQAELLYKSLRGELSATEEEELSNWRAVSSEHERFYQRVHREEYIDRELSRFLQGENKNQPLWQNIRQRTVLKQKRHTRRWIEWGSVAALLFLSLGLIYFFHSQTTEDPAFIAETVMPGTYKAILYTGNGEQIKLSDSTQLGEGIQVCTNRLEYDTNRAAKKIEYHTLKVPRGGEYNLQLSDGTKIFLNSESELRYPVFFDGDIREISLKGEAFFDVARDVRHPFVVQVGEMQVKVLGTSFNVNAYNGTYIETALVNGKITVKVEGTDNEWQVKPSELLRFNREDRTVTVEKTDLWPYIAWKEGQFLFQNQNVGKIMDILARWYDIEINYRDEAIKNLHFTGDIRRHTDIRVILNALTASVHVKYTLEQRKLTLFYN